MAKLMQDIVTNNKEVNSDQKTPLKKIVTRKPIDNDERSLPDEFATKVLPEEKEEISARAPAFSSLEASPIFEKMKQHNKDRESFSDEFGSGKRGGQKLAGKIFGALLVVLLLGAFLYGMFFHSAVLSLTLKHADVVLQNQEFSAVGATGTTGDALTFQTMTLSEENSADLVATGEKNVVSKSSGQIVIYNDYGTQSQALIKNTRFQTPDGKIYRIHDSVVVPGQKVVGGKQIPGSLEVTVYADAAGPEYNIGQVDFTIPGFKSSPRYEKIYARSKTAMTGGFSGPTKIVSPDDIQKAKETLIAGLKDKLLAEAVAQKPKDSVLYKDTAFYNFTESLDNAAGKSADDKTVKLTVTGSLTAVLFNAEELSKRIVKLSTADVSPEDRILVTNIGELTFVSKIENKDGTGTPPKEGDTYAFSLNGEAQAIWQINVTDLQEKLAGVKKVDYKNVFIGFPGIEKANASIHPFWKTKFPADASKIQVEIGEN